MKTVYAKTLGCLLRNGHLTTLPYWLSSGVNLACVVRLASSSFVGTWTNRSLFKPLVLVAHLSSQRLIYHFSCVNLSLTLFQKSEYRSREFVFFISFYSPTRSQLFILLETWRSIYFCSCLADRIQSCSWREVRSLSSELTSCRHFPGQNIATCNRMNKVGLESAPSEILVQLYIFLGQQLLGVIQLLKFDDLMCQPAW